MRKITTVALDDKSAEIAKSMPNFSHFVRESLYRYSASQLKAEECPNPKWQESQRCNPLAINRGHCFICWPGGRPEKALVKLFLDGKISLEQLDEESTLQNRQFLTFEGRDIQPAKELPELPSTLGFFASIREKYRRKFK